MQKRLFSLLLSLCMMFSMLPMWALAEEPPHTHNTECGYIEAAAGSPCTHTGATSCSQEADQPCNHTDGCGYAEAVAGNPCSVEAEEATVSNGNLLYRSLEEALSAANDGDTLKILKHITVDAGNTEKNQAIINITKNLTIDGGDRIITVTGNNTNDCNFIGTENGSRATIKNIILAGDKKVKHGINAYGASILTLSGVTIKNFKGTGLTVNGAAATAIDLTTFGNGWGGVNVGKGQGVASDPVFTLISGNIGEALKIWADNVGGSTPAAAYVIAPEGWTRSGSETGLLTWDKKTTSTEVAANVGSIVKEANKLAEEVLNNPGASEEKKEFAKETINAAVEEAVAAIAEVKNDLTVSARKELADKVNTLEKSFVKANEVKLTVKKSAPIVEERVPETQKIPAKPVEVQGLAVSALAGKTIEENTTVSIRVEQKAPTAEQQGKIVLSITPQITVGTQGAIETISNSALQAPVTFKVYLNNSFKGNYADIVHQLGADPIKKLEEFRLPVQTDQDGKYITITVIEFSDFIVTPVTVSPPSGKSSSDNDDSQEKFWDGVANKLKAAKSGETVTIDAKHYDNLPWTVMDYLYRNNLSLSIKWNGGEDILIPEKKALNESNRTYYSLSYLAKVYRQSTHTNPQTGVAFEDVQENDWFADAVYTAVNNGWFTGTSKTAFSPYGNTTRGMIATVLWRMEKEPTASAASIFEDVANGAYYADGVNWAQENGIVGGYGNGKFGPEDNITREQMASILYRYAQFKSYDVSKTTSLDGFTDGGKTSEYAKTPMAWAVESGLVSGKGNNILDSKAGATRAEVATVLTRFDEMFSK